VYSIPVPLVGKVAELFLKKQNEREGEVNPTYCHT
jgi:hypothetical protein